MASTEQQFVNDLDKKLWTATNKLRSSLDATVYKHAVLGIIFLKYVNPCQTTGIKSTLPAQTL